MEKVKAQSEQEIATLKQTIASQGAELEIVKKYIAEQQEKREVAEKERMKQIQDAKQKEELDRLKAI